MRHTVGVIIITSSAQYQRKSQGGYLWKATYVGGNSIWIVLLKGKMNVFSVGSNDAWSVAPANILARVGTLGGRYDTLLTFQMAFPAICEYKGYRWCWQKGRRCTYDLEIERNGDVWLAGLGSSQRRPLDDKWWYILRHQQGATRKGYG